MQTYTLRFFLFCLLIVFSIWSCQNPEPSNVIPPVVNLDSIPATVRDSVSLQNNDYTAVWSSVKNKLEAVRIPCKISCDRISDSVQFELSQEEISALIPQEMLKQKSPVVSALYNLKKDTSIIGTFYAVQYPVIYNQLMDIRCEIFLVLYTAKGQYTDFKTLAVQDYGNGYTKIKSLNEILYLYSAESQTLETDIITYALKSVHTLEQVNTVHFSSGSSQQAYDNNQARIEKIMN